MEVRVSTRDGAQLCWCDNYGTLLQILQLRLEKIGSEQREQAEMFVGD
jgi:hypothetical protein